MAEVVERVLSSVERFYWLMDRVSRGNFVMIAELQGGLEEVAVRRALDELQGRHPMLAVQFLPHGRRGLMLSPCRQKIEFRVAKLRPDESWVPYAEEDQVRRFELESGPLVRCSLLSYSEQRCILLLTFHHSIADANAGAAIVDDLLCSIPPGAVRKSAGTAAQLISPLETRLPDWILTARGLAIFLWRLALMWLRWLRIGIPRQVPLDVRDPSQRRDRYVPLEFDEQETTAIVAGCKAAKLTVNAVLHAAQLLAIADEFPEESGALGILCQVDLRRRSLPPIAGEQLGLCISFVETSHRVRKGSAIGPLARSVQESLACELARQGHLLALPWLAKVANLTPRTDAGAAALVARNRRLAAGITVLSNIGTVTCKASGGQPLMTALHFLVPLSGGPVLGSAAASFNGRLRWNFTYSEPNLSKTRAERIALRARQILLDGQLC